MEQIAGKLISEIKLSQFNNDSSFTSNAGTVTSVATGTGHLLVQLLVQEQFL